MTFSNKWETCYKNKTHSMNNWPFSDLVSYVMRFSKPGKSKIRVLELGCGSGANIPFLLSKWNQFRGSALYFWNVTLWWQNRIAVYISYILRAQILPEALVGCVGKLRVFSWGLKKIRMKNIVSSWRKLFLKMYFPKFYVHLYSNQLQLSNGWEMSVKEIWE